MYANAGKNGMPTKQELSHWKTHKNGGPPYETETTEEVNKDAMDGMMKARIAYEAMHGNPAALRMVAPIDNPYDFGNGELGTHYMSSYDNYAIPNIQDVNGTLNFTGPRMEEAIKFDRPEDAIYFAENYKKVAPIFNKKYKGGRIKHYGGNIPEHYHPHMNDPSKEAYYSTLDEKFANEKENFINYLNHPFYQQNAQTAWGDDAALNIQKQIDRINNTDIRHESNALMNYAHGTGTRGLYIAPEEKEGRGEIILRKQPGGSGELHTIGHEIGHASDVSPVESGRSTEYFPVQKQMYPEFSGYYPENLSLDSSYVNDPQYKEYLELPTEFRTRLNHVKQLMAEDNFNWNEKTGEEISEWLQQNNYNYGKYHELAGNNRMMLGNNALQEVDQISKYNLEDQIRYSDTYGDMYRNYANKDWRKEKKKEGNKHYQKAWRKGIRTPEQWLDHFNFVPENINPKELLEDKDMDGVPDMQYQIDPSIFKKKQNPEFLEHVFKELAQQQANPNQPQIAKYGSYLYDNGGKKVTIGGKTYDTDSEEYRKLYAQGNIREEMFDPSTGESVYGMGTLPEFEVSTMSDATRARLLQNLKDPYQLENPQNTKEWAENVYKKERPTPEHLKPQWYKGEYHSPSSIRFHEKHGRFPWEKTLHETFVEPIHTGLDVAGMLPGVGLIPDLINAGIYGLEGDAENAAWSSSAAVPLAGLFATPAKYVKKGLKYADEVVPSKWKGIRKYNNPDAFEGIDIANMELDAMKSLGKKLDAEHGYFDYSTLSPKNAKYHGVNKGRPIVEVELPTGDTQLFYKSTGLAGKKGVGTGGTTEGLWQPYAGHVNIPKAYLSGRGEGITKNWFIKDAGYKDWYGSNAFRDISGNLNRLAIEGNWDLSDFIKASKVNKKYGGPKYPSGPYYPYKGDTLKVDKNYDKTHVQPFAFAHGGPHDPPKLTNTFSDFNNNIIVNDKNDPRYVNYQNHLKLYENYKWLKDNIMTDKYYFPNHPEEGKLWDWKKYDSKNLPYPDFDIVTGEINTSPGGHGWRDAMADYIKNWRTTLKPWREDSANGFTTWGGNNSVLNVPYPEYEVTYKGLSPEEIERRRKAEELRIKQEEELRKQRELETIISNADLAHKNKQLLEQELLYEKPLSNIPEGYSLVKGDYDPAFGEYGNYYTSLTGEGKDIPVGKTEEDYLRWKGTLDNRGYPTKPKYGPDSKRTIKASFKNGGNSLLLQVRDKLDRIQAAEKLLNKFKNARYGKV